MTSEELSTDPEAVVSAYVDGQATAQQVAWLQAAAGADPDIGELIEETRALKSLLMGLERPVAPDAAWARMRATVADRVDEERRRARVQHGLGLAAAVLAVCAVALGAVLVVQGGSSSRQGTTVAMQSTTGPFRTAASSTTRPAPAAQAATAGVASLPVALGPLLRWGSTSAAAAPSTSTTSTTSTRAMSPATTMPTGP